MTPFFREAAELVSFGRSAIVDVDQDGRADIVASLGTSVGLLAGNGTLIPDAPVTLYDASSGVIDVITADVNDDDEPDIIFSGANHIGILYGGPGRTFTGPILVPGSNFRRIATGDFNEDGRLDLFAVTNNTGALFLQGEEGQFTGGSITPSDFSSTPRDIVAGDFDLNGDLDIVTIESGGISFLPGKGDGTFWPIVRGLASGTGGGSPMELETADLDGDGDLDVVSTNVGDPSVKVWINQTGYSWSAEFYPLLAPNGLSGRPVGLTLADFNGDGDLDAAAGGTLAAYVAVLTGNGDATFDDPSYTIIDSEEQTFEGLGTMNVLRAIDLDLDGRIDIVGEQQRLGFNTVLQNLCALAEVEVEAPELISVGTTLQVSVLVSGADEAPIPTGTVTLMNGATPLDSDTLTNGAAQLSTNALGVGTHALTVTYSGDANFDPAVSDPFNVTVTTETTTVTITKSIPESTWGQPVTFTATVTASDNTEPIVGTVELWIDGAMAASGPAPSLMFETDTLTAGTHQLQAYYLGSEDHPPSSTSSTFVVNKATANVTLRSEPSAVGSPAVIEVLLGLPYNNIAEGTIDLYEGATLLGTIDAINQPRIFTITNLAMGTHELRAVYSGDANVIGDDSPIWRHTVLSYASGLDARGGASTVTIAWGTPPPNTTQIQLTRAIGNGGFALLATFDPSVRMTTDVNVVANTVYRYRVHYLDSANVVLSSTNIDLARLVTFTDDVPLAGRTIRAVHITELRDAANALRAAAGLAPITLNATGVVLAAHITQLRTAIDEARAAFGAVAFTWEADVAPGQVIRASHVQQLRDAVR